MHSLLLTFTELIPLKIVDNQSSLDDKMYGGGGGYAFYGMMRRAQNDGQSH